MKKLLMIVLIVLVCMCCLTSCAQVEQKIGKVISVEAVEAVASQFEDNDTLFERADEQRLAEIQAALTGEYAMVLQGQVTAALIIDETDELTGEWVKCWVLGFDTAADADAFAQLVNVQLQSEIGESKAVVVSGGYIVSVTLSSSVIEQ